MAEKEKQFFLLEDFCEITEKLIEGIEKDFNSNPKVYHLYIIKSLMLGMKNEKSILQEKN